MQDWINAFLSWIPYILSGVTLLASGGGIAALVTGLANRLSTKRQNEIEIKKHRMDILVKSMHNYDNNKQLDLKTFDKNKNICSSLSEQERGRIVEIGKTIKKEPFFTILIFMLLVL